MYAIDLGIQLDYVNCVTNNRRYELFERTAKTGLLGSARRDGDTQIDSEGWQWQHGEGDGLA